MNKIVQITTLLFVILMITGCNNIDLNNSSKTLQDKGGIVAQLEIDNTNDIESNSNDFDNENFQEDETISSSIENKLNIEEYINSKNFKEYSEINKVVHINSNENDLTYPNIIDSNDFNLYWISTKLAFDGNTQIKELNLNILAEQYGEDNGWDYYHFYFIFKDEQWFYQNDDFLYLFFTGGGESGVNTHYITVINKEEKNVVMMEQLFQNKAGVISGVELIENTICVTFDSIIDSESLEYYIKLSDF